MRITVAHVITLVGVAALGATAQAVGTLESGLETISATFGAFSPTVASDAQAASLQPDWHLSLFKRPAGLLAADYVSVPVAAAPVCLAYNLSFPVLLQSNLDALGAALTGSGIATLTRAQTTPTVSTQDVTIAVGVAQTSPASAEFLKALSSAGVTGFTSETWPSSVTLNSAGTAGTFVRVLTLSSDQEVAAALADGRAQLGAVALASGSGLPCLQLRVTDPNTLESAAYRPYLPSDVSRYLSVSVSEPPTVETAGNAYPVVGALVLSLRRGASCTAGAELHEVTMRLLSDTAFTTALIPWGFGLLGNVEQVESLAEAVLATCGNVTYVAAGGSSAIEKVASAWSTAYTLQTNAFMAYVPDGSGSGIRNAKAGTRLIAGSDALLNEQDRLDHPNLKMTPATAFAVAVIFNVNGVNFLNLPRCVIVDIFKTRITMWNDPRIVAANPAVVLPALPIKVTVRATKSGTTEVFTTGLFELDSVCTNGNPEIEVTNTWALNATIGTASTGVMLRAVQATDGAIGYVATASAEEKFIDQAVVVDERSGTPTSTAAGFVQAAIDQGEIVSEATGQFVFPRNPTGYPFVGITYFLIDTVRTDNCSKSKAALDWVKWALTTSEGQNLALSSGFVPVGTALQARAERLINSVTCDGALLYPAVEESNDSNTLGIILGVLIGLVVIVGALLLVKSRKQGRDLSAAPKDESTPFSVMFTDIQNSTGLWALAPEEMGTALDTHHRLIRESIEKHGGYEVKTIGDAFMVAFKDARAAVECALSIQTAFMNEESWSPALDDVYRESLGNNEEVMKHPKVVEQLSSQSLYHQYWRGLRVRVGVHTGLGEIKLDEITQAYDYYGTVVNTSARIESVSHGGQVTVSTACLEAAFGRSVPEGVRVDDLGEQELRGLNERVPLHQVLPLNLAGRGFPSLRLEKAASVNIDDTNTETDSRSRDTSRLTGSVRQESLAGSASLRSLDQDADTGASLMIEQLAGSLVAPLDGKVEAHDLVRYYNFARAMLAPAQQKDRRELSSRLRKIWRIDDDYRGPNRTALNALGQDTFMMMMLASRVAPSAEMTFAQWSSTVGTENSLRRIGSTSHNMTSGGMELESPSNRAGQHTSPRHRQEMYAAPNVPEAA